MAKKVIKINEATLKKIVAESVKKVLNEEIVNHDYIELGNDVVGKIEKIKAEVKRLGEEAYEQYKKDCSDKFYWTYMTCKKITNIINNI